MLKIFKAADFLFGFLVIPAIIIILNYFLIWPQFHGIHTQHIDSIEISYIQMAKFLSDLAGHASWQPFWYFGFPMYVFYTPLLPFAELILGKLTGIEFATAYRILTGTAYIIGPASLYFFVWRLTKRKIGGMVAAAAYSFLPTIFAAVFNDVKGDYLATILEPRRYTIFIRWGEGPHIFSLVFVPLAGLFYIKSLESGRLRDAVLAAFFLTLIAISNPIGLWAAGLLIFAILLGNLVKGEALKLITISGKVALITLGFSAFWYNPSFISSFFKEGGGAVNNWLAAGIWGVFVIIGVGFGVFWLTKKVLSKVEGLGTAFWFFAFTFLIVFVYYKSGEARIELVPQALRLNTEVDLALSVILGVVSSASFAFFWTNRFSWLKLFAPVLPGILLVGILTRYPILASKLPAPAKSLEAAGKNVQSLAEFRVAKKLEQLVGNEQTRVVAPGNYGFWLNYFTPIPQLRGALFQSSIHHWPDHIYYQVANGKDAAISLAWLKIGNISHLVYTTGVSAETYKDYKVPTEKFDSVLVRVDEDHGDIYYQVPLKNSIPAKLVSLAGMKNLKVPFNAIDEEPIFSYLSWMEEKSDKKLSFEKINNTTYKISGRVIKGEGILVQDSFHSGWTAKLEDRGQIPGSNNLKIKKDPLGFMVIIPKSEGEQTIILQHGTVWQVWFGWSVTAATLGIIIWKAIDKLRVKNEA